MNVNRNLYNDETDPITILVELVNNRCPTMIQILTTNTPKKA